MSRAVQTDPLLSGPNKDLSKEASWTFPVILAGISTCIGLSIPVGYCIGNINAPGSILRAWVNSSVYEHYDVPLNQERLDLLWSTVVSVFLVGGMVGSLSGGWIADKLGRRGACLVAGILQLIAAMLFLFSKPLKSVEVLLLARITCGLASGLTTAVVPMYLMECAPINLLGAVGILCPMALTFGVLLGQVVSLSFLLGTENEWHYLLSGYLLLIIIGALCLPWLEESPKYLYAIKKDKQEAIKVLTKLRNMDPECVVGELNDLDNQVTEEKWSVMKLLTTKSLLLNLALVCSLQAGQQLSGINAVFYYSVDIFMSAGLSKQNAEYGTLGAGGINFIMAVIMIPIVNNNSRRTLAVTSCSLAAAFLIFLTASIALKAVYTWISYLAIVGVLGYVLTYGMGLGPIPYFIGSELFDVGPRPSAMALGSVANWTGNFLVGMLFPSMQHLMKYYSFLIFAGFTAALTAFLVFCLPETNAKILAKRRPDKNGVDLVR